jgi:hypothetical protein
MPIFIDGTTDSLESSGTTVTVNDNLAVVGAVTVSSNLTVTGLITEQSSIVYKENVEPLSDALALIMQLTGVSYNKKDNISKTKEIGLIAEEVNKIFPEIVTKNIDGTPYGIQYTKLTAYLVEAIKELKQEIETLKDR